MAPATWLHGAIGRTKTDGMITTLIMSSVFNLRLYCDKSDVLTIYVKKLFFLML